MADLKAVVESPLYQGLQPSEREKVLGDLYDEMVATDGQKAGIDPRTAMQVKNELLQELDPSLFGWRRGLGYATEFASGLGGAVLQMPFGAANLAMKGLGIEPPQGYTELEKGLTEQRTTTQKAGAWTGEAAMMAIPWLGEAKAASLLGRGAAAATGMIGKGLGGAEQAVQGIPLLGKAASMVGAVIGGIPFTRFAARTAAELPIAMGKVGLVTLLETEDGRKSFDYALSMAYLDRGEGHTIRYIPGFGMLGPSFELATKAKLFPARVRMDPSTAAKRWTMSEARNSIHDIFYESMPQWLMKGILNTPPQGYRLGRDPEAAVIREGFFGARMPITLKGWKKAFRKRIDKYDDAVRSTFRIADEEGVGAELQPVIDTIDDVINEYKKSIIGDVRTTWVKRMEDIKEGLLTGSYHDINTREAMKAVTELQRQKIEFGAATKWWNREGYIDIVTKGRRRVYHAMDEAIDKAAQRTRTTLEGELAGTPPPVGQQALPYRPTPTAPNPVRKADLENKLKRLINVGDYNDRIANLLSAENAVSRVIDGTLGEKAWYWGARLGKLGALGAGIATLNYMIPGTAASTSIALGMVGLGLGTPQGRAITAYGYQGLRFGYHVPEMMAGPLGTRLTGAGVAAGGIVQSPPHPDPLGIRGEQ